MKYILNFLTSVLLLCLIIIGIFTVGIIGSMLLCCVLM
jgi:hypothetical protein